jgi:hypothetical protein
MTGSHIIGRMTPVIDASQDTARVLAISKPSRSGAVHRDSHLLGHGATRGAGTSPQLNRSGARRGRFWMGPYASPGIRATAAARRDVPGPDCASNSAFHRRDTRGFKRGVPKAESKRFGFGAHARRAQQSAAHARCIPVHAFSSLAGKHTEATGQHFVCSLLRGCTISRRG